MSALKGVAAVLAFALEVAMLAGYAAWSLAVVQPAVFGVGLAVVLLALVIGVWGAWLAPKAPHRLPDPRRTLVEAVLIGGSAAALYWAGYHTVSLVFAALLVVRFVLGAVSGLDREGL